MSRQPYADATATLGTVHQKIEHPDAVHLAVHQVQLGNSGWGYNPGCMLSIGKDGFVYETTQRENAVGILDPFLQDITDLNAGDKVWLVLFPGMITSLRHVWEHPAFPSATTNPGQTLSEYMKELEQNELAIIPPDKRDSYIALRSYAENLEITVEKLLREAAIQAESGNHYYTGRSEAEGMWLGDDFWKHYEAYTSTTVLAENKTNFISCSC